jgi:membrane protein YdbS with pleckstrin-like domain
MEDGYKHIDRNAKSIWHITGFIKTIVISLIAFVIAAIWFKELKRPIVIGVLSFGLIVLSVVNPIIRYGRWRYRVLDDRIDLIYGIYWKTHSVIPTCKIQYLKISQGVIQRIFKVSSVQILTAGNEIEIENIDEEDSKILVERLQSQIERDDENGREA